MPLTLYPGQTDTGSGTINGMGGGVSPNIYINPVAGASVAIPAPTSFSVSQDGWNFTVSGFTPVIGASYSWSLTVSPSASPGDYTAGWYAQETPTGTEYFDSFPFTVLGSSSSGSGTGGSSSGSSGSSGRSGLSSGSSGSAGGPGSGPPSCCDGIALPLGNLPQINASQIGASFGQSSGNLGNNPQVLGNNFQGPNIGQYGTYGDSLPVNVGDLPPSCTCGPSSACNTCGTGSPGGSGIMTGM